MKKKIAFYTLGCKVNTFESESIYNLFSNEFTRVDFKDDADVYIINTCSVTNTADSKSRKIIRNAINREHDKIVCVMGCYAQSDPDQLKGIDGIDIVIGNDKKSQAYDLVMQKLKEKNLERINKITDIFKVKEFEEQTATTFEHTRAFLKIQDGCNNYCSYCIIPFVRGHLRSRNKENTIEEVIKITNNGYKEIVLSGIHTGKYGTENKENNYYLKDLLKDLLEIEKLKRLRISSIEINEINDDIIELLKNNHKMAKHLHLPLQAGSDKILKDMNRKYLKKDFLNMINNIRKHIPDICITTDVIVGFPGETEELFNETLEFCREVGFYEIHVFPYSRRRNTVANDMKNQIPEHIKSERVHKLQELSNQMKNEYINKFINKEVEVILETKVDENTFVGHSSNYLKIYVKDLDNNLSQNDLITVKIKEQINDKIYADFDKKGFTNNTL